MTKHLTITALCALLAACGHETPSPVDIKTAPKTVAYLQEINEDVIYLAATIRCEAEGEITEGLIAVGQATMARVKSPAFPDTVKGVVTQRGQYSCWAPSSPVYWKTQDVLNSPNSPKNVGYVLLAEMIYWNALPDVGVSDAHYYMNAPKASTKGRAWQEANTVPVRTIGNHQFRKEKQEDNPQSIADGNHQFRKAREA